MKPLKILKEKKLKINKETLRSLTESETLRVVGTERTLPFQDSSLYREVFQHPVCVFQGRRRRALAQRQPSAGGIQHADGFVG